jgi:hypothetical protein
MFVLIHLHRVSIWPLSSSPIITYLTLLPTILLCIVRSYYNSRPDPIFLAPPTPTPRPPEFPPRPLFFSFSLFSTHTLFQFSPTRETNLKPSSHPRCVSKSGFNPAPQLTMKPHQLLVLQPVRT